MRVYVCVCVHVCVCMCVCWHICCRFDKCFDQKSSQDEVFQNVARPVIDKYVNQYTRDLCFFVFFCRVKKKMHVNCYTFLS